MSRPFFDRTAEFRSAVESAAFRAASSSSGAPLLPNGANNAQQAAAAAGGKGRNAQRSEFARMAAKIGKDIQATTGKLEKLAQREWGRCLARSFSARTRGLAGLKAGGCHSHFSDETDPAITVAKRKTLFDDRPVEISVRFASSAAFCSPILREADRP